MGICTRLHCATNYIIDFIGTMNLQRKHSAFNEQRGKLHKTLFTLEDGRDSATLASYSIESLWVCVCNGEWQRQQRRRRQVGGMTTAQNVNVFMEKIWERISGTLLCTSLRSFVTIVTIVSLWWRTTRSHTQTQRIEAEVRLLYHFHRISPCSH